MIDDSSDLRQAMMEEAMREVGGVIGAVIKKAAPPGEHWGFFLGVANFGAGGDISWISNLERPGAIEMLAELIDLLKSGKAPHRSGGAHGLP